VETELKGVLEARRSATKKEGVRGYKYPKPKK
jgi:hypothetical protein